MIALTGTPTLETERLILRAPRAEDWAQWAPFALSQRAEFIGGPYEQGSAWRAFGHLIGHWVMRGYGTFVVTRKGDDTAIGATGPWHPANWPEKELGWTIWDPAQEGKGVMFEAAQAARDHAFGPLGWDTAVSYIHQDNARSMRLAERLGARRDDSAERPHPEDVVYRHGAAPA